MNMISVRDVRDRLDYVFQTSEKLKEEARKGIFREHLKNKSLAMIFEKASTRTRVSFEVAMSQLGGHAVHLEGEKIQLYRGESMKDTALTLSRYVDAIMIRARHHVDAVELAKHSSVPVINGLTDLEHPCQALSDLYTIKEAKGFDIKLAYVGDGNNVCNSLILGSSLVGMDIAVGCPPGYEPNSAIVAEASGYAENKSSVEITHDAKEAVKGADIVYTDVWVSMGQEKEEDKRFQAFKGFQVNSELLKEANNPLVMHCLPAKRGLEITDEVMDSDNSIIFEQAENRLHVQKALLCMLLGKSSE
ncbi:MAG: ornithine carbamoyltransferase [Candidatus Hydrothermarchaeales archaeon]